MTARRPRIAGAPAIRLARPASPEEMRLIRAELNGLFGRTSPRLRAARPRTGPTGIVPPPGGVRLRFSLRRDRTAAARAAWLAKAEGRSARAVTAAVAALGVEAGRHFLSVYHRALNGPPAEMAAESDAGLRVVEAAISIEARRRAAHPSGRKSR